MAQNYNANEVVNGLYGSVYDENGSELQAVQEFETTLEFEKEEITIPGRRQKAHKVMSSTGSGSMTMQMIDSRLARKIAENPAAKFNYIGALKDPTSRGEESVMLMGVSFDSVQLINFSVGELVEKEFDFTFDDFRYLKSI